MGKPPPVFFFAFANGEKRYLRNLADEEKRVREALDKARRSGLCQVEVRYNATADTVWNVFLDPEFVGRIAVFHFGGHAGSGEIVLETPEGAPAEVHAAGLAGFLGHQAGLQLVFLNGCSTAPQVQALLAAHVPAVIATERDIDDEIATDLSARFYQCLGVEAPLSAAFEQAVAIVRSRVGDSREKARRSFTPQRADTAADWPWDLHPREKLPNANWRLGRDAARKATPEITQILPYLCDRRQQEGRLDAAISSHRLGLPRRPLAVLLHGDYRQALDRFIDCLQDPTLPHLLSQAPLRRFGPLTFKDPGSGNPAERLGPLWRGLAEKLCGQHTANLAAMANEVAASKGPVMIDIAFSLDDDEPPFGSELLAAWLGELARWPDLPQGQDLIFLLRFSYHEPAAFSPFLFWKKSPSRRVEDLISRVVARPPAGLGVASLPPLGGVKEADVRLWIEEHVQKLVCEEVGVDQDSLICDRFKEKALELFRTTPSLSMEELAPKLRSQLLECLQQGGA
jgi:hypothetical protein